MRRYSLLLSILLTAVLCAAPKPDVTEAHLVKYARQVNIADLDVALRSAELGQWLVSGPPHIERVEWSESDCDIKPDYPEPKDGYPLCVKGRLARRNMWGWLVLTVGTVRRGVSGRPQLRYVMMTTPALARRGQFRQVKKLSELPMLISDVAKADEAARSLSPPIRQPPVLNP